jgi:hypothetical protein
MAASQTDKLGLFLDRDQWQALLDVASGWEHRPPDAALVEIISRLYAILPSEEELLCNNDVDTDEGFPPYCLRRVVTTLRNKVAELIPARRLREIVADDDQ